MMNTTLFALLFAGCGAQNASSPTPTPTPAPEAPEAAAKATPAEPAMLVSGTITAPEDAPEAKAVYVSLRKAGVPGPPLAAKRLPAGPFPLTFVITESDRPMVNGPVPDEVELKVTLDVDGDPMSKSETDLVSITTVERGAKDLQVALAPQ
ncbi:MAG: hypothetical protein AAGA48_02030 [Myxococcota bacterium]